MERLSEQGDRSGPALVVLEFVLNPLGRNPLGRRSRKHLRPRFISQRRVSVLSSVQFQIISEIFSSPSSPQACW
jgi:hypothetical protein